MRKMKKKGKENSTVRGIHAVTLMVTIAIIPVMYIAYMCTKLIYVRNILVHVSTGLTSQNSAIQKCDWIYHTLASKHRWQTQ